MLGVLLDGPALMLGDNKSAILSTSIPSSVLKKKHCSINWHRCREAVAAGVLDFVHVDTTANLADLLTKPLDSVTFHSHVKPLLFRAPRWHK